MDLQHERPQVTPNPPQTNMRARGSSERIHHPTFWDCFVTAACAGERSSLPSAISVGPYVVDYYCPSHGFVVESMAEVIMIGGSLHDQERQHYLESVVGLQVYPGR